MPHPTTRRHGACRRRGRQKENYLVAHAQAHGHIVVTHETAGNSSKPIEIPDACSGLAVKRVTPFEMLRQVKARLVMKTFAHTDDLGD
ncbi:hypothetical protein GCM10009677_29510 [Sphaerisporangium rubeum]|uniref:DUF4411 family protein n=1 Tax=Sphaerisporangium rubeum TaxID=321317 RepID=A0A7X0IES4_9ACTN|nr:DUF4411 family protein [Sphaerisporangium rubeum]MBB6473710.1 hypothetical protein [Sphaerisporangium rubeum]